MIDDGVIMVLKVDKTVDCSGKLCPYPVIEASRGIKTVEIGQVLQVIATDPGSPPDMEAWARQTGHILIDSQVDVDRFVFLFQRTK